ncbi:hypothetical protein Tco_0691078 [Tanacetum coccineum]
MKSRTTSETIVFHNEKENPPARANINKALGVKASANSDVMYSFTSAQDGDPLQDDVRNYVRAMSSKSSRITVKDMKSYRNVGSEQFHRQSILNGKGLVSFTYFCERGVAADFRENKFKAVQRTQLLLFRKLLLVDHKRNDFGGGVPTRDIIVSNKSSGPQMISELHPSYMALQYPLLFLYGEDGYHDKIPYHSNTGTRKTIRGYVTMKEYYAYIIQYRKE